MFNKEKLQDALVGYKKDFTSGWWEAEKYKWEAVKAFKAHWDIDASDFPGMLYRSLAKTGNLLASSVFPRQMIEEFAQVAPEEVREMFRALLDESTNVVDRVLKFNALSDDLLVKYHNGRGSHYQDMKAISTYLWLRYPDKYCIYRITEVKNVARVLGYDEYRFISSKTYYAENLRHFYSFYNEIYEYVNADSELLSLFDSQLTESCYSDPLHRTLAADFCYYISQKNQPNIVNTKELRLTEDSQDPMPTIWKISHGTDSTGVKKELREKFAERHVVAVDGTTKAILSQGPTQGQMFIDQIQKGDYFYLCYGNSVQLLGQIVSDKVVPNVEKGGTWCEREYQVIAQSKDLSAYKGQKKMWTPNYNSTCIPIKNEKLLFEELILKPYFGMTIKELSYIKLKEENYWWLNANPKIWSYTDMGIGEIQSYTLYNDNGNKRRIFQNFLDVKPGDKVIGYEATPVKQIVALCEIVAAQDDKEIKFKKTEHLSSPIPYAELKECPELAGMEFFANLNGSLFRLSKDEYNFIMDRIREGNPINKAEKYKKYTEQDFLNDVFMDKADYDNIKAVLEKKKNIILQGAPGVGKTYMANRLAYSIMGKEDKEHVTFIQFHQNYSYEDFIMGYKPDGEGFTLKTGVFHEFCTKAANHPDEDYFFIIDEINRGNMSKIFGELLMLIESDYRGMKIPLAYDERPFSVPKNLYIIGMMNTADRSLAMIDYALRRRFSFIEMVPAFDSDGFKRYQKGLGNETFDKLIATIKELNEAITTDGSLGKGFVMGHSYFCKLEKKTCTKEEMGRVVRYDIIPMLEEYWFDEESKLRTWKEKLLSAVG